MSAKGTWWEQDHSVAFRLICPCDKNEASGKAETAVSGDFKNEISDTFIYVSNHFCGLIHAISAVNTHPGSY